MEIKTMDVVRDSSGESHVLSKEAVLGRITVRKRYYQELEDAVRLSDTMDESDNPTVGMVKHLVLRGAITALSDQLVFFPTDSKG